MLNVSRAMHRGRQTLNDDYESALSLEMLFMTLTGKKLNRLMSVMALGLARRLFVAMHFMNGNKFSTVFGRHTDN